MCTFCSTLLDTRAKIESYLVKTLSPWPMQANIFFNKIIKVDESWGFAYDSETKRQSSEWFGETSTRSKKLNFQRSRMKTKLVIFFDSQGVVHKEFIPEGKTVNVEFCKGEMDRHLKSIQRVRLAAFCS